MNGRDHIPVSSAAAGQEEERGLRRYTAEEDERILREWWQKEKRPQLMRDLGRTKAALAQRYYLLLRELGITPEEHRRQQLQAQIPVESVSPRPHTRARAALAGGDLVHPENWTPEREAFLWRQARNGTSFEEIAEILGGVTPGECRARYLQILEQAPGTVADRAGQGDKDDNTGKDEKADRSGGVDRAEGADRAAQAGTPGRSERAVVDTEGELWATLAALPERLERLEAEQGGLAQRVAVLESAWDGWIAGLQEMARALPAFAGTGTGAAGRTVQEAPAERIMPLIRELGRSLQAFLRLGHWEKIRQLPAFLSSLDEKLAQLEERVTAR